MTDTYCFYVSFSELADISSNTNILNHIYHFHAVRTEDPCEPFMGTLGDHYL